MPTIYELDTAKKLAKRWEDNALEREPYLGEGLFNTKKQIGTKLDWFQGKRPKVRLLSLSSFDAKVIPIGREGFKTLQQKMPFFKNSMVINEDQRQDLNNVVNGGNTQVIDAIMNVIFDDKSTLLKNASLTREMLRMQLVTTGTIAFANNGQVIEYDFDIPAENKVTSNWNAATTADPIADIISWQDQVEVNTGVRPTQILMNRTTLAKFAKMDSVKNAMYVFANGTVTPNTANARRYIEQETETTIYTYDKGYTDEDTGKFVKFVADDVVVLFPAGTLGDEVFGTTPEESDLMNYSGAEVSIVDTGVAITGTKLTDPVNVETKVSMIYLPVLNDPETMIIASVKGE